MQATGVVRSEIEGLVQVVAVVTDVHGIVDRVDDVSVLELVLGSVLPSGLSDVHVMNIVSQNNSGK